MSDLVGNLEDQFSRIAADMILALTYFSWTVSPQAGGKVLEIRLTHLSLAPLLWDIGKQNSPICDAAECGVTYGAILFAQ